MSYQTEAVLFYGLVFPSLPRNGRDWVETDEVHVGMIGSAGDEIRYATTPSACYKADLDTCLRLPTALAVDPAWDSHLRAWCERNGTPWPVDGAGWHLGPGRF